MMNVRTGMMTNVGGSPFQGRPAVVYARVSSKDQEKEGFSIPSQQKLLRGYAQANSLNVVQEFVDIETAKKAGRTGFGEMLTFLKKTPACKVLLVEKTDRLYRNLKDWVVLDELHLEIHLVKENVILSEDSRSSEKFMHGIKVLMAKNYVDNLSEESSKGMLEKAEQGIWPSYAPLGYRNVLGPNGKKVIEPDPVVAPLVVKLFEWYATGNHSMKQIAKMAREAGLTYRKSGNKLPTGNIHLLLHNRIYTGDFVWDGKVYKGVHTPLISKDLWEHVQSVLAKRLGRHGKKRRHDFAFSGLLTCGHCGGGMVGELKKEKYVYYHCCGNRGECLEPYVKQEVLDAQVGDLLRQLTFDEEVMAWITDALRQSHVDEKQFHADAISRLQTDYCKIQNRIDAMYEDKLDNRVTGAFFDTKAAEWRAEQDRIMRDIERHQAANQNYIEEGIQLLDLARRAADLYEKQDASSRRELLGFILSNSVWADGKLTAEFRQPFNILALATAEVGKESAKEFDKGARFEKWYPLVDVYRTFCLNPTRDGRLIIARVGQVLALAS